MAAVRVLVRVLVRVREFKVKACRLDDGKGQEARAHGMYGRVCLREHGGSCSLRHYGEACSLRHYGEACSLRHWQLYAGRGLPGLVCW